LGANSCLAAYEHGAQIIGTTAATFDPLQENEFETQEKRFTPYHMLKRNTENKSIQAYYHSGFGDGIEIDIGSINKNWLTEHKPPPEPAFTVVTRSDSQKSNENVTHSTERKEQREKERKEGKSKA